MKSFNNEIVIRQGQSFTIDKLIENLDSSPYIISNKLQNPYFLITVSSSAYEQANLYVKNYWLDLKDFPRFLVTQPIDLASIKTGAANNIQKYTEFPASLPSGYINGAFVQFDSADDAVFCLTVNGVKQYKRYVADKYGVITNLVNYECRLIKHFSSIDTKKWPAQSYLYSIRLVSGPIAESGDKPISEFDNVIDILQPTKLSVLTSLKGGV